MIADGAIMTIDISDGQITSAKIANGTIVNEDISDNADISGSKIANASIPLSRIENVGAQTFQQYLDNLSPGSGTITSAMIADGAILTEDISDGQITSAKIANGTIVNEDISDNADISGSKIESATETNAGVVTIASQSFSGLKTFTGGVVIGGNYSRNGTGGLTEPLPAVISVSNTDLNKPYGHIDVLALNTHATHVTNAIIIQIPIDVSSNKEVSSYYEITLIGTQPITAVDEFGASVTAASAVASTTRCLLTVTGIAVTTTLLGISNSAEPFVTTALKRFADSEPEFTTNLMIAVGFRKFTAYHIKGVRVGAQPTIHFVSDATAVTTQAGADTLISGFLNSYN